MSKSQQRHDSCGGVTNKATHIYPLVDEFRVTNDPARITQENYFGTSFLQQSCYQVSKVRVTSGQECCRQRSSPEMQRREIFMLNSFRPPRAHLAG
jgi:hypothetical protein